MRSSRQLFRAVILAAAAIVPAAAREAHGQIVSSWISPTSGFWNQSNRWSTNPNFPNNNEWDVVLPGTSTYTVTLNAPTPVRIASLTMTNPNATFIHTGGVSLQFDDFMNIAAGTYSLNNATLLLGAGNPFLGATNAARMDVLNSQIQWIGPATATFQNSGRIDVTNSSFEVGQLVNSGTINLSNSSLVLEGDTTISQLNNVTFANNSGLLVQGDLVLQNQNFSPGYQLRVQSGSVSNGTISAGAGPTVQIIGIDGDDNSYFRNVYIDAPIIVNDFATLNLDADSQIAPGRTITLDSGDLRTVQPLDNSVEIVMGGLASTLVTPSIEPGVVVRHGAGTGTATVNAINRGQVLAESGLIRLSNANNRALVSATNGAWVLTAGQTSNSGTIIVGAGGTLSLGGQWRNTGTISVAAGTVDLTNIPIASNGTFQVVNSSINVKSAITTPTVLSVLNGGTNNNVAIVGVGAGTLGGGTLINGGSTLAIDLPWSIRDRGFINGGTLLSSGALGRVAIPQTITPSGGQPPSFGAVFEDVRIGAPIDVASAATLSLVNSTVIPGGVISLNGAGTFTYVDLSASTIAGEVVFNDTLQTGRGVLRGAFNTIAPTGVVRTGTSGGNLQAVSTFLPIGVNNGLISAQTPGATLFVGSFTNNGTMQATNGSFLDVTNTGLINAGTLHVESGGAINLRGLTQWLPTGTLSGGAGGGAVNLFGSLNLNNGTITVSAATGSLFLRTGSFVVGPGTLDSLDDVPIVVQDGLATLSGVTLRGRLSVQPTASALMSGNWSNSGFITADNARAILAGNFTTADFANIRAIGGTITLGNSGTSSMVNAGNTMSLTFNTGTVELGNGITLNGGTIAASGGAKLNVTGFGTLSNVVTTAPIVTQTGATMNVINGLTLANLAKVSAGSAIQFRGTQTLAGAADIAFEGGTVGQSGGTLTIAPTITIRTGSLAGTFAAGSGVVNQGLISAQTPFTTLFVNGTLTNQATVEAINGASMTISASSTSFNNTGIVRASDGGRVSFAARPANLTAAGTLSAGTWIVDNFSTMTFATGSIVTNSATLQLSGGNAFFNGLTPLSVNSGTIAFDAGYKFSSVGTLSNSGKIYIGSGSAMRTGGPLVNSGTIDVNGVLITTTPLSVVQQQVVAARSGGSWDGGPVPVITSSAARDAFPRNLTLGVMDGDDYLALYGTGATLGGYEVVAGTTLVRSTFYGDADFNGTVNFDDYSRIDDGFNNAGTDWFHGDFDLNGTVNFDDYALIDLSFNTQSNTLARAAAFLLGDDRSGDGMDASSLQRVAQHFATFGEPYAASFLNAIPEPATAVALASVACTMRVLRRSRGRRRGERN